MTSERRFSILNNFTRVNMIILAWAFILFTFLVVSEYLTGILVLLGAALILTYVLLGPVTFLESSMMRIPAVARKVPAGKRRAIAIILVYLLFFTTIALVVVRVLPPLSVQVREFARDLPTYLTRWEERTGVVPAQPDIADSNILSSILKNSLKNSVKHPIPNSESPSPNVNRYTQRTPANVVAEASSTPATNMSQILSLLKQYAAQLVQYIFTIGSTTITGFVYMLTALVMVFYMLQDGRRLKEGFVNLMPTQLEDGATEYLTRLHLQFFSFIKGQVVMSFIAGGLMFVLLSLLGVKYAFLLSMLFGITSIIPVIGPWFGLMPVLLVTSFSDHPFHIINVMMFVGIYYLLKAYWLWPRLIQRDYDIHPVIFILTFLACLKTVSFLGILMSFPLATILAGTLEFIKSKNADKVATAS